VVGAVEGLQRVASDPGDAEAQAARPSKPSLAEREVAGRVRGAIDAIRAPGRWERFRYGLLARLPVHPNYLKPGTVFTARLQEPIDFGTVAASPMAPPGAMPALSAIIRVVLTTTIGSDEPQRGAPVTGVLNQPVVSDAGLLILPEGTELRGTVTQSAPARHFHRSGKLRFLFASVTLPGGSDAPLYASLHAADLPSAQRLSLDDEGGLTSTSSKWRLALPVIAVAALSSVADPGEAGVTEVSTVTGQATGGVQRGLGSFMGLGLVGVAAGAVSKPVALGLSVVGVARTVYDTVFGRGRDIRLREGTPVELQLAPGPRDGGAADDR
jgi:hypothetical protein